MLLPKRWPGLLLACLAVGPLFAVADEPVAPQAEDKAEKKVTAEELEDLCKKLDSANYTDREEASRKLFEAGKPAIELLTKTAEGESREASSRAFNVLKQLYQNDKDEAAKTAAEEALKKLSKSDSPRLARRANEALKAAAEKGKEQPVPPGQAEIQKALQQALQGAFGNGNFQFNVPNAPAPDPVKKAKVKDGNKKIEIEKGKKGIKVKVTEKIKGKDKEKDTEKVTEYKAKDLKELKKKHPEAAKLYKKHKKELVEVVQKPKQGQGQILVIPANGQFQFK